MKGINSDWVKQNSRLTEADCLPELKRRKMNEKVAARMFEIRENQLRHNPYDQELRETEAVRRGDVQALEQSILEEYAGELGVLNEEDSLRNVKNLFVKKSVKSGENFWKFDPPFYFPMIALATTPLSA